MKKPIGAIVYGIIGIITGAFGLVGNIILLATAAQPFLNEPKYFLAVDLVTNFLFLLSGFGVIELREKFRKVAVFLCSFTLIEALAKTLFVFFAPAGTVPPIKAFLTFLAPVIVFNLVFFLYFNKDSVKTRFQKGVEPTEMTKSIQGYEPAGTQYGNLWKRGIASIVDAFIIGLPMIAIALVGMFFGIKGFSEAQFKSFMAQHQPAVFTFEIVFRFIIPLIYFTLTVGKNGRSLGKKALGLKIIREGGSSMSYQTAFFRYLFFFLYNLPYLGILLTLVSASMILFDKKRQALHDKLCKTLVVHTGN